MMTLPQNHPAFAFYPTQSQLEDWIDSIWQLADATPMTVDILPDPGWRNNFGTMHMAFNRLVRFSPEGMRPFYGIWQPVVTGPCPLAVHLPGYGAELSVHPDTAAQGFNVLQLSPMGYWTPDGFDESLRKNGHFPVLPDTIESHAREGYRHWLLCCVLAVRWAWTQPCVLPDRVSFYGTSQGGGTSLLCASIFMGKGLRCAAADEPFLTNYPQANWRGAYQVAHAAFDNAADKKDAWHSLGFVDTLSHAHRLTCPVLLSEGGADEACPPDTIEPLYDLLPSTKAKYFMDNRWHGYNREFMHLVWAWLRLYA